MKRVKITGFGLNPKVKYPEVVIKEFKRLGFTFPVFGSIDDDVFFFSAAPWAASVFQYEYTDQAPTP